MYLNDRDLKKFLKDSKEMGFFSRLQMNTAMLIQIANEQEKQTELLKDIVIILQKINAKNI